MSNAGSWVAWRGTLVAQALDEAAGVTWGEEASRETNARRAAARLAKTEPREDERDEEKTA